jgi:uncharacterized membrane protein
MPLPQLCLQGPNCGHQRVSIRHKLSRNNAKSKHYALRAEQQRRDLSASGKHPDTQAKANTKHLPAARPRQDAATRAAYLS